MTPEKLVEAIDNCEGSFENILGKMTEEECLQDIKRMVTHLINVRDKLDKITEEQFKLIRFWRETALRYMKMSHGDSPDPYENTEAADEAQKIAEDLAAEIDKDIQNTSEGA